ncbi:4'-phosphopantetheinyl transferase superfamily protein [Flavobacterium sp. LS1R49]|uniref:4'-phosphopantetheinyl transferase superfamily protein n=1 Tax=Flavobacterium shii TaxID=2987687 RepID=A0A9X2ZFC2_9FLAO|nr:4'-phosphopantetheinyl transferase superfamily protein [Flavobacterium shii]MCV9928747.1 4'-phosphopantetheinyl transferase superfamily protein [Flavobacterium shii]
MIGNDIVDLEIAKEESNWKRKGFLDKIFTAEEQFLILNSEKPEIMVWNLWSRKEAAYKIFNRETKIRGYFPLRLVCIYESEGYGEVTIDNRLYFTKTKVTQDYVYTIAVLKENDLNRIVSLDNETKIYKETGIPYVIDVITNCKIPVSISHHGRFMKLIRLA